MTTGMTYTEIRIHGVSGTPPEDLLAAETVRQAAGDETGRFHRAVDAAGADVPAADGHVVEGYHWGTQTSGTWRHALWLALVPFGLVNAAPRPARRSRVVPVLAVVISMLLMAMLTVGAQGPLAIVLPPLIVGGAVAAAVWAVRRSRTGRTSSSGSSRLTTAAA